MNCTNELVEIMRTVRSNESFFKYIKEKSHHSVISAFISESKCILVLICKIP